MKTLITTTLNKTLIAATLAIALSALFSVPMDLFTGRASAGSAGSALTPQSGNSISINDASLVEGDAGTTRMVFTVTLTATGTHTTIGVDYATANGAPPNGATATQDYLNTSGLLLFPSGSGNATRTIEIPILGDLNFEPDEIFFVNLTIRDSPATIGDGQGVGTIINDDNAPLLPSISIADASIAEGSSGTTDMRFTVTLTSTGPHSEVVVSYEATAGLPPAGATPGQDFQNVSGTLRFPAGTGNATMTIAVPIIGDSDIEPDETFFIELESESATIGDSRAAGTIFNDDAATPLPTLSINNVFVQEGDFGVVAATFRVSLSFAGSSSVSVDFATADGTAISGADDYEAASGTVTFIAGDNEPRSFTVFVNGDQRNEPNESFFVQLSNPRGATIGVGQAECTILDDDSSCTYEMTIGKKSLIGQIFTAAGGTGRVNIDTQPNCPWAAVVPPNSFVRLSAVSGSGSSTLTYTVEANPGPKRTARIHFGPSEEDFTVIQEGTDCPAGAYRISREVIFLPNEEASPGDLSQSFTVEAPEDCTWTATTEDEWIDVEPPHSRQGLSTVHFRVQPNLSSLWRSGAINVAGKTLLVHQISVDCVEEFVCGYFPSGPGCGEIGTTPGALRASRRFRDDVLLKTPRGRHYAELYYRFSKEAVGVALFNPMLILRSREMLERYIPVVRSMADREQVTLTDGDLEEIEGFLRSFGERGSTEFRDTIRTLCDDLRDAQVQREFNITVTRGPKRKLVSRASQGEGFRAGKVLAPPFGLLALFFGLKSLRYRKTRTRLIRLLCIALASLMIAAPSSGVIGKVHDRKPAPANFKATEAIPAGRSSSSVPLSFEVNQGQADSQVRFLARAPGYNAFFTSTEAAFQLRLSPDASTGTVTPAVLRMRMIGSNPAPLIEGLDRAEGRSNYYAGEDPAAWNQAVPNYSKIRYSEIYEGIDLVYYGNQRELEYDFNVAPGADPASIRLRFGGVERLELDSRGDLVLRIAGSEVRHRKPVAYQDANGTRREVPVRYVVRDGDVEFAVGEYDPSKPLVIDPVLAYSSYLGGSRNEEGNSIAVDSAGNVYVAGFTDSINFPLSQPSQPALGGRQDVFVLKLDPTGTRLLYSTYIGGNGQDNATSIAVDHAGNANLTGFTDSANFPQRNPIQPGKMGEINAFVVKLDSAGAILNSTLLGGSVADFGSSIAVDQAGNVYVAGLATSPDIQTAGPIQSRSGGLMDVFVAKIDPGGARLLYSTYLGGNDIDAVSGIAVDSTGSAYVTGMTSSRDYRTVNAVQPAHGGGVFDAFVAKLNASGTQLVYSTFIGGGGEDRALRIAVDHTGSAYVTGDTDSMNFPVSNGVQGTRGGRADAFITKLSPEGSAFAYSSYLGGSGVDVGTAVAVDSSGSAYVAGFTSSTDFPTAAPWQPLSGGGPSEGFVARLNPSGAMLDYSSYLGGSGTDSAIGVAVGPGGAHVLGVTDSTNFPTRSAFQPANRGGTADIFIARITAGPRIASAMVNGKNLIVSGSEFDGGAKVLIDGVQQKTIGDAQNPAGVLIGKKSGKKIGRGQTVTLRVRNSSGELSNDFRFTRP